MNKTLTRRVFLAAFFALLTIIQFSPLSQITFTTLGITITLMHIIVLVGVFIFEFYEVISLGFVFGLLSMMYSIILPSFANHYFINPMVSIVPRVLFAMIAFGLFKVIEKQDKKLLYPIWAFTSTAIHTTLVLTALIIFNSKDFGMAMIGIIITTNAVPEMILAAIIVPPIGFALKKLIESRT